MEKNSDTETIWINPRLEIIRLNKKIYEHATKVARRKKWNPHFNIKYSKGTIYFSYDDGTITVKRFRLY